MKNDGDYIRLQKLNFVPIVIRNDNISLKGKHSYILILERLQPHTYLVTFNRRLKMKNLREFCIANDMKVICSILLIFYIIDIVHLYMKYVFHSCYFLRANMDDMYIRLSWIVYHLSILIVHLWQVRVFSIKIIKVGETVNWERLQYVYS